jgi:hypothetical protein
VSIRVAILTTVATLCGALSPTAASAWSIETPSRNILCAAEQGTVICQILHQNVARSNGPCEGVYSFVGVLRGRGSARLRQGCYTGVVAVANLLTLMGASPALARKRCGQFAVTDGTIEVRIERGQIGCAAVRLLMREFWSGRGTYHQRTPIGTSYSTLHGWRCPMIHTGYASCAKRGVVVSGTLEPSGPSTTPGE